MHLDHLVTYQFYEAGHRQATRILRENVREEIPDYGCFRDTFYQCGTLLPQGCHTLNTLIQDAARRPLTYGGDVY